MLSPSSPSRSVSRWFWLAVWLLIVFAIAAAGATVTTPKIGTWYAGLTKPAFTPPNWVFGPVWSLLYALMAIAAWRVARGGGPLSLPRLAAALFFGQLLLNGLWTPVFFGLEAPTAGLAIIFALLATLAATVYVFGRRDFTSGVMLAPYLAWVAFATALNAAIVVLN